ncbi:UbiD family decarboxylase [Rhodospirillaceae bacterium SYSU D60014]|uniref:UbiD family decarboxylase n=1 Tax=Virgifigura deserti TaxID=2268457 RepID=UPI000E66D044
MSKSSSRDLRSFLAEFEAVYPSEVLRIADPIDLDYEATAIALELERHGRSPVLWFENVRNSGFPVLMNLYGRRNRFAFALGLEEDRLIETWASVDASPIAPTVVETGPVLDVVATGAEVDLARLPIMRHFVEDGGSYLTNAMFVAKDPETGVRNASFHRLQVNGRARFGTSLHSRRHLWNYARKARAMGLDRLPVVVVVGCHPLITFGSGLWKGPIDADEYAVAGGFLGEPLPVVNGVTVPVEIPATAEIAIEGHLLLDVDEPEGPFGEFTGYASERSTHNAMEVTAILHRRDAIYHSIVPGISDEHTLLLGISQEARQLKALRVQFPNVRAVAYPKSGTCLMHCYVSVSDPAPGQPRNIAAAALGDNLSLKLVVVVDEDVDVHDEQEVLWAMATRFQADTDLDVIRSAMGATLDPSNHDGLTAKLIVDATRKKRPYASRHSLPEDTLAKARALLARTR